MRARAARLSMRGARLRAWSAIESPWKLVLIAVAPLALVRAGAAAAAVVAPALECKPLANLDGLHCYGLEEDLEAKSNAVACRARCCQDEGCESWQFHPDLGCFRGQSYFCTPKHATEFCLKSLGSRLRHGATNRLLWKGVQRTTFSRHGAIEPFADGPDFSEYQTPNGEIMHFYRYGPREEDINIYSYCWSVDRDPKRCCAPDASYTACRWAEEQWAVCCGIGNTELSDFALVSHQMSLHDVRTMDRALPKIVVDEHVFAAVRQRWRIGVHEPHALCSSGVRPQSGSDTAKEVQETITPVALQELVRVLEAAGTPLSRTFVNIGAGRCTWPDPMHGLVHSDDGRGFIGLAIDANATELERCREYSKNATANVVPVHLVLEPLSVVSQIAPHLATIFASETVAPSDVSPRPLDVLVIDIDGLECLVVDELLHVTVPKILIMETAVHVPPPFRFSMQYDVSYSTAWQEAYNVEQIDAAVGCSLSYALHMLRKRDFFLLRLASVDAIYVHKSIAATVERSLGVRFPQDEFECYRRSRFWMMLPPIFVREWFFAPHPALALGAIWRNLSLLNLELQRPNAPFSLDY